MSSQLKTQAEELRRQGLSFRKIAKTLGKSPSTIRRWLNPDAAIRQQEYFSTWWQVNKVKEREKARDRRKHDLPYRVRRALRDSKSPLKRLGCKPCCTPHDKIVDAFDGCCDMCGVSEDKLNRLLALDHDHSTGVFRGWLCDQCNMSLGTYETIRPKAEKYLGR